MRNSHWIVATLTSVAGLALGQGARPPLRMLETGIRIEPVRVAHARIDDGRVERVGEWMAYGGARGQCAGVRVFDCYGDCDSDGYPDDCNFGCGLSDSRWYYGTGYCNNFVTNDMTVRSDADLPEGMHRVDLAWWWTCVEDLPCFIGVWTQDSDADLCEPDTFDYEGFVFDFGVLECHGGYFWANIDICDIGRWPYPKGGRGSYAIGWYTSSDLKNALCAQPMLWGTSDLGPGWQGAGQIDDDNPPDLEHQIPGECYTYSSGVCPDPLGAMAQFWGMLEGEPCEPADCDSNGEIDSLDVLCFFNLWAGGDAAADCDENGSIDTRDVLCFLNLWNACR